MTPTPPSDEALARAAELAARAAPSSSCLATRHGSYQAHRRYGCRCPETNALVKLQRDRWEVDSRAAREVRLVIQRASVREEVVKALLRGERSVAHTHVEARTALERAITEHGEDVEVLAGRLGFDRRAMQRRLRVRRARLVGDT